MSDLADLRSEVLAARTRATTGGALSRMAADGLTMIYDRLVPPNMRLADGSQVTLTVTPERTPSGLAYSQTVEHFMRAVASIGLEIREPNTLRALKSSDYDYAPVRTSSTPGGPIVLAADVTGVVMGDVAAGGHTVAQMAMARLANILPSSPNDMGAIGRVASSRATTLRAAREVAIAAKRLGGVKVSLMADDERVDGSLDVDQAKDIIGVSDDVRDDLRKPYEVTAIWDGMRFSRREFFLRFEKGRADIDGLVDEALVPVVRELPDELPVIATVQDVVRVYADNRQGRRTHHLIDIRPAETLT